MPDRIATFSANGETFYGAVADGGVIALSPDFPQWPTLREVIEAGALEQLVEAAAGRAITHPDGSFRWEIPIPAPEKKVETSAPEKNEQEAATPAPAATPQPQEEREQDDGDRAGVKAERRKDKDKEDG